MEYQSMGQMIHFLRKEKGLTQKQLADMLNITDKAVSKWERDIACPDTTALPKLAEILGVTVESLLNVKIQTVSDVEKNKAADDANPHAEMHQERVKQLLRKGLIGFVIGFVFMFVVFVLTQGMQENSVTVWTVFTALLMAVIGGLVYAGIPYGWELINKLLEQWLISTNILVWIILFVFKIMIACCIGCFAYPVALLYNIIRSQKTMRRVRAWTIIIISVVVLWYTFVIIPEIING